jgi:hypothetical protein
LNASLENLLIVVFTPTYHSFGKVTLCLNSYKDVIGWNIANGLNTNFYQYFYGVDSRASYNMEVVSTCGNNFGVGGIFHNVSSVIMYFWWTPRRLQHIMEKQGRKGPKTFHIFVGNMHEIRKFCDEELLKDLGI